MVESWGTESSRSTRPSPKWEVKIQVIATEVTLQVEGAVMVEEIGQLLGQMIASNVADLDTGTEIVLRQVVAEVGAHHSRLLDLGMVGPVVVGTDMQMIMTGTWMIDMTEVVMVIKIVMTTGMIDMEAVIDMLLMTGIIM